MHLLLVGIDSCAAVLYSCTVSCTDVAVQLYSCTYVQQEPGVSFAAVRIALDYY